MKLVEKTGPRRLVSDSSPFGTLGRCSVAVPLVISLVVAASAQDTGSGAVLEVGADRLVSTGIDDRPIVEPHLAVDPGDPDRLLAVAMVARVPLQPPGQGLAAQSGCSAWLSEDGGGTWVRHDFPVSGCADPWAAFAPDGTALFAGLSDDGLVVYRSPNGGRAWEATPFRFGAGHDHPTLAVDRSGGRFDGSVYLASGRSGINPEGRSRWTVYVARSDDAGRSFPVVEQVIASNLNYEAQVPAVLSDSTLLVPFSDHHAPGGRRLEVGARRSWLLRSGDGANTFSEPLFVTDACDGRGGWPSLAADPADRALFLCVAADSVGILLHASEDRAETWTGPVRVDDGGEAAYTRTPSLAVAPDGVVGVSWYDGRGHEEGVCQRLRFSASLDGGGSFLPSVPVSDTASCPETEANGWTAARFPTGGDYSGLVATGDGHFHAVWSDSREGIYRLRGTDIAVRR